LCGIAAVLYKVQGGDQLHPVGSQLREMLYAMRHRGVDSTGMTVCGESFGTDYVTRLFVPGGSGMDAAMIERVRKAVQGIGGSIESISQNGSFSRVGLDFQGDVRTLADAILAVDGVEIHSIGKSSEIIKDTGDSYELDQRHGISGLEGTHGVGHVRLATESQVDIRHSHPFWAYPFADISVVHNGQLTNYHTLTRKLQQKGYRFQTHNDSEVIGVYIADKLSQGVNLSDALEQSLDDLDGTFTYVVTTASGMGVAKDRWSAKPFVVFETPELVGVASEEVALRKVFPENVERFEPQEHTVLTWNVALAPVIGRSR
jgi:methylamine---glutamate N-methyltransferase subunit A